MHLPREQSLPTHTYVCDERIQTMTKNIAARPAKNIQTPAKKQKPAKKEVALEHQVWATVSDGTVTGFYPTRTAARTSGLGTPKRASVRIG